MLDLTRCDWDPKLEKTIQLIDPDKPHVVFANVGRGNVSQTPPIRLERSRPLAEAWTRATPKLPAMPSPEASVSLSGVALDARGKPGRKYSVILIGAGGVMFRETADAVGRYRFRRIPPGKYTLNCNPPGKGQPALTISDIVILAGKRMRQDASLAGKFILVGRVTDAAGAPIPNVTVDLSCRDRGIGAKFMDTTRTDAQGRYRLSSPLGTVTYIGVKGRRINGAMPRLTAGENLIDFSAEKGRFRTE